MLHCVSFADLFHFTELTDAISEDWGGKPFVDLRKGWQYILDNYPEVSPCRLLLSLYTHVMSFSSWMLIVRLLQEPVGVGMQSSECFASCRNQYMFNRNVVGFKATQSLGLDSKHCFVMMG